jgi:hypothetical protein
LISDLPPSTNARGGGGRHCLVAHLLLPLLAAGVFADEGRVVSLDGTVTREHYEQVLERPFEVPPGVRGLDIRITHDGRDVKTVLDLGLRGPHGLRGWSGGSRDHIWVGPLSSSPGYLPGAIEPGRWHVMIGVANVRAETTTKYHVEVRLLDAPPLARPVLGTQARWYAGDLHVHSGHSDGVNRSASGADTPGPVHRVLDAAVRAGLDFVALTDHNTASHWLDVDRLQPFYDRLLILHAREVTTYQGHLNAIGETSFTEFHPRGGGVRALLDQWAEQPAFLFVNHPQAPDDERCIGCGWNDTTADTLGRVHGVEVRNGTWDHWRFWADRLNEGVPLVAVGGSDEHRPDDDGDGRRVGAPTTMVYAEALSEEALVEGLRSGRVYVLPRGGRTPALELSADIRDATVAMGSALAIGKATEVVLRAWVRDAAGQRLVWIRNGEPMGPTDIIADTSTAVERRVTVQPGDWLALRIEDERGEATVLANAVRFPRRRPEAEEVP